MTSKLTRVPLVLAALALTAPALAGPKKEPHFDVYIYTEAGRIKTGAILEEDAGVPGPDSFTERVRVFGAEMGEDFPNFADEPGFDGERSFFPGDPTLAFFVHGPVRAWDGTTFDTVSSSSITIDYLSNSVTTPAGNGQVLGGFSFDPLPDDTYHLHFDYTLNDPQAGIYLLLLSLYTPDDVGVAESKVFAFVFNNGLDEEEHEAAIRAAYAYVPGPGGAAALAMLGASCLRRRRGA